MSRTDNDDRLVQALDAVLTRLMGGEDIATCLASYPDLADELSGLIETRMRLDIPLPAPALPKEALEARRRQFMAAVQAYQIIPARRSLWQRVRTRVSASAARRAPWWALPITRVAIALVLAAAGIAGASQVAQASMPDSPLYPLKLGIEDVRLSLTADPQAQANLAMIFIVERADELEHLAYTDRQAPVVLQTQLVKELNTALRGAARMDVRETAQVLARLSQLAETQRLRLARIAANTPPADRDVLHSAEQILAQAQAQAQAGMDDPQAFHHGAPPPLISPLPLPGVTSPPAEQEETALPAPTSSPEGSATLRPTHTPAERSPAPLPSTSPQPASASAAPEVEPTPKLHESPTPKVQHTVVPTVPSTLPEPTHVAGKPTPQPTSEAEPRSKPTAKPTHQPDPKPTDAPEVKPTHPPDPAPKPTKEKRKDS